MQSRLSDIETRIFRSKKSARKTLFPNVKSNVELSMFFGEKFTWTSLFNI